MWLSLKPGIASWIDEDSWIDWSSSTWSIAASTLGSPIGGCSRSLSDGSIRSTSSVAAYLATGDAYIHDYAATYATDGLDAGPSFYAFAPVFATRAIGYAAGTGTSTESTTGLTGTRSS
jgi:hypothetical protein